MTAHLTTPVPQGETETALIIAAKGALPPTEKELRRYEELKARGIDLTGAEHKDLIELQDKATRKNMSPQAADAERELWEKYGSKSDGKRPISNKKCTIERALEASFFGYADGVEQPFKERGGNTISLEKYEEPRDSGIEDDNDFERAQRRAGERKETIGPPDGFVKEEETPDDRLPLLDVFPAYISDVLWVFWEAIRRFDPEKTSVKNPKPLAPVIWAVARSRIRDTSKKLPHGLAKFAEIKDDRSQHERILEIVEAAFQELVIAADAAVDHFIRTSQHATDVAVLGLFWPTPGPNRIRPEAVHAAEIARRLDLHRSVISKRIKRIRRRVPELDEALERLELLDGFCRGKPLALEKLATLLEGNRIIDRGVFQTIGPRHKKVGTGEFVELPPYDPYWQESRRVRLKSGKTVRWFCQRAEPDASTWANSSEQTLRKVTDAPSLQFASDAEPSSADVLNVSTESEMET